MHRPPHAPKHLRTDQHHPSRSRAPWVAALVLALASTALAGSASADQATDVDRDRGTTLLVLDSEAGKERGTHFRPTKRSTLRAVRYFRAAGDTSPHRARIWNAAGRQLAEVHVPASTEAGWQRVELAAPVRLRRTRSYAVSVALPAGTPIAARRPAAVDGSDWQALGGARGSLGRFPARQLKRTHFLVRPVLETQGDTTSTTGTVPAVPARTTTTIPAAAFPNASNTGVPDAAALTPYAGPSVISTPGAVIDGKLVSGTLVISAPGVTISRSQVNGSIKVEAPGSLTITDSTVDGGTSSEAAVSHGNITMRRVEVVGARASVACNENCDIQDSWLHAQYIEPGSNWHGDGFLTNGGENMLLRHNTLACDSKPTGEGGACSAAMAAYGDFSPVENLTVDNNLFVASPASFCLYGGYEPGKPFGTATTNVVITNNVFQRGASGKCAVFGPANAVAESGWNGNVWSGNTWDDGKPIR